jgi:hypothetical protein
MFLQELANLVDLIDRNRKIQIEADQRLDGKRQTNPSERGRTLVLFERGFSRAVGLG